VPECDDNDESVVMYGDVWNITSNPYRDFEWVAAPEPVLRRVAGDSLLINDAINPENFLITREDIRLMDYSHILQLWFNKRQRLDGANEENVDVQMKMKVNVHIVVPTVDQVHAWPQWNQCH
jgi:hypothetical protein